MLFSSADFSQNHLFQKKTLSGTIRVSNGLGPDLDLIWVKPVYKGYQHTTNVPASKERGKNKVQ